MLSAMSGHDFLLGSDNDIACSRKAAEVSENLCSHKRGMI